MLSHIGNQKIRVVIHIIHRDLCDIDVMSAFLLHLSCNFSQKLVELSDRGTIDSHVVGDLLEKGGGRRGAVDLLQGEFVIVQHREMIEAQSVEYDFIIFVAIPEGMVLQTVWNIENISFGYGDGFIAGFDFGTAFDHLPNVMTGRSVGLKMVRNEIFIALPLAKMEGIQELCIVHAKRHHQFVEYYLFSCSILSCCLNCQEL